MPVYVFSVLHFERSVAYSKTLKKRLPGISQRAINVVIVLPLLQYRRDSYEGIQVKVVQEAITVLSLHASPS